jgi:hypothetical protein
VKWRRENPAEESSGLAPKLIDTSAVTLRYDERRDFISLGRPAMDTAVDGASYVRLVIGAEFSLLGNDTISREGT